MAYSPRLLGQPSPPSQIGEKLAKTWDILQPYVTGPYDAFWRLAQSPAASGFEFTEQDAADALTAGGGAMMAGSVVPKPNNALMMGYRAFKGMHGADEAGNAIDLSVGRGQHSWDKGNIPHAGFYASNPEVASYFADALTQNSKTVFPVDVTIDNPIVIDGAGRHAADFQFGKNKELWDSYFTSPDYADNDGVLLKNVKDAGGVTDIFVPKKPSQVKHQIVAPKGKR